MKGEQRRFLERIRVSTGRFGRLIDELTQISTSEADPTRISLHTIDLRQEIRQAVKETNGKVARRHLELNLSLPEGPLIIESDPVVIRRVVSLLLRNAFTVSPDGGEVGVKAWLESRPGEREYALVQVTDQGAGMDDQTLRRVFSLPQEGGERQDSIPGLAASEVDFVRLKALVEALRGRIWVDSQPGQGATFSVLIPTAENGDSGTTGSGGEETT